MVSVDISGAQPFFDATGPDYAAAAAAHRRLTEHAEAEDDFAGWLDLPRRVMEGELKSILAAAERIRSSCDAFIVAGVGGSYLGAKSAIDFLKSPDYNVLGKNTPDIYFVGNNLSGDALRRTLELIGERDVCVNVISKSGATLETSVAFRVLRGMVEAKYGDKAKKRIFATTDPQSGLLHDVAVKEGWERFTVPPDVGGRYSVLSAVGLLPMAVCGVDIRLVLEAAAEEFRSLDLRSPVNPAWQYAAVRRHLYRHGKAIELFASFEPRMRYFAEWWKQLFGESEGKTGVGIFPASVEYTADLHSMGQLVQDGTRNLIETVVSVEDPGEGVKIPFAMGDADRLNYLAGKELRLVNSRAAAAVKQAHIEGGVPNIGISVPDFGEASFASLVCFFELSCAVSGYMLGVNPFDQPGVEAYKAKMRSLLEQM